MYREENEIEEWLEVNGIEKYKIEKFGSGVAVNVSTHLIIRSSQLQALPVQFGVVEGNCYIEAPLQSLVGAPRGVKGSFTLNSASTTLESLTGAPAIIGGDFICRDASLKRLQGSPRLVEGSFIVANNLLTSLKHAPMSVGQDFDVSTNPVHSLTGFDCEVNGNFIHTCDGGHRIEQVSSRYGLNRDKFEYNTVRLPGDLIPYLVARYHQEKIQGQRLYAMKSMRSRNKPKLNIAAA